jgi:4'-phosphopantetheinyl transferase
MVPLTLWRLLDSLAAPRSPLEPGEIHVWLLSAMVDAEQRAVYRSVLSPDERERADRFRFMIDHDRCIVGRGGLRQILSWYCNEDPANVQFEIGSHGKPSLRQLSSDIHFNMSHAGDYVMIGVTEGAECGVDVEQHSQLSEQEIAERFFCRREVEWMKINEFGFTRLWTMKEAIVKAVGRGLSIPLNDVDAVDVATGNTSRLLLQTPGVDPQTLSIRELRLSEGYSSSIAAVGLEFTLRLMP